MVRSNLSTKFNIGIVNKFQKKFRQDNEDCKNKNVARYITVDIIARKGIPDIEDVVLLIKLGNNDCDEQQAYDILQRWLDDENNKERGILGAFCDLCKDYAMDIPVDSNHRDQCFHLEDYIQAKLNMKKNMTEVINQINEVISKANKEIKEEKADAGTTEVSTQE